MNDKYRKTEISWRLLILLVALGVFFAMLCYQIQDVHRLWVEWLIPVVICLSVLLYVIFGWVRISVTNDDLILKIGIGLIYQRIPKEDIVNARVLVNPGINLLLPGIRVIRVGCWYNLTGSTSLECILKKGRFMRVSSGHVMELMEALK
jgi:hypothetical protein